MSPAESRADGAPRDAKRRPRRVGSRFCPFTLLTILALWTSATATESVSQRLAPPFLRALGWSIEDLFAGEWQRLVLSALVSHGGWVLARATLLVLAFVGLLERRHGTAIAAATFWTGHLATLVALALVTRLLSSTAGAQIDLEALRDVGPSAGYLSCAAVLLHGLSSPWPRRLLGALLVTLVSLPPLFAIDPRLDLLADLAHIVAFFGAWALWATISRRLEAREASGSRRRRSHG